MTQQALGRHHDQWFAPGPRYLAAQAMKVLSWRGRLHDLDVIIGGQTQKPLQPRTRMLRPAAFEAVRQEQDYSAQTTPFVLSAGDELIDNDLRGIPEIAELRFPRDQALRAIEAVTVL